MRARTGRRRRTQPPRKKAPSPRRRHAVAAADPIKHVVVLMLENRPFDQVLGGLQKEFAAEGVALEGIDPDAEPRANYIQTGPPIEQLPLDADHLRAALTMPDPMHELANVKLQLGNDNSYFVLDYVITYNAALPAERELIMRYFAAGALPATHALARHFAVCDRWFASVPGPTWTNRFFVHSGTSIGRVHMPEGIFEPNVHLYNQDTIYDRLNERDISWRVYYGDVPHSLVLVHQWKPKNARRYRSFDRFPGDAKAAADSFPAYVFIEPSYLGDDANDDHPPHDVMRGQRLIADVYNALRGNEELFNSTLLVVLYDEHGGFYDHVVPPNAIPPDAYAYEYDFTRLGVRVPVLLISPWVEHAVVSTEFDHTSLLRYLLDKWKLGPLGNRTAAATSIGSAIRTTGKPRTDIPDRLSVPAPVHARRIRAAAGARGIPEARNDHQQAMVLFSQYLEESGGRPPARVAPAVAMQRGMLVRDEADASRRRVDRFLTRRKASPR